MAASPASLRQDLARLTNMAGSDLAALWQQVDNAALRGEALMDVLPALVQTYGSAAASISADWYDELRLSAEVRGATFWAIPADNGDAGAQALVGWATSEATDDDTLKTLIAGGLQRRIWNYSRDTVQQSSHADPRSKGWARVGQGENCRFCNMLISRGAVYSAATVDFGAHDHCDCIARPSWGTSADEREVREYAQSARRWLNGNKTESAEADDARAKAWIAANL